MTGRRSSSGDRSRSGLPGHWVLGVLITWFAGVAHAALPADELRLSGVVKALESAELSSQTDGLIAAVTVREGETFAPGDVLIELDCDSREATLDRMRAQLELATAEVNTTEALARLNSVSDMQVARAMAERRKAAADVRIAEQDTTQCTIAAPFAGHVVRRDVRVHEVVQARTPLLSIVNNDSLYVEFLSPSARVSVFNAERPLTFVVSETGKQYGLRVDRVVPQVDPVNQTVKVIARIDSLDAALWSGMSGWITLE